MQASVIVFMEKIFLDCGSCLVAGAACNDCMMSVLVGVDDGSVPEASNAANRLISVTAIERDAMQVLATGGLIPPLRLVSSLPSEKTGDETQVA